jgi:hypothetical protein
MTKEKKERILMSDTILRPNVEYADYPYAFPAGEYYIGDFNLAINRGFFDSDDWRAFTSLPDAGARPVSVKKGDFTFGGIELDIEVVGDHRDFLLGDNLGTVRTYGVFGVVSARAGNLPLPSFVAKAPFSLDIDADGVISVVLENGETIVKATPIGQIYEKRIAVALDEKIKVYEESDADRLLKDFDLNVPLGIETPETLHSTEYGDPEYATGAVSLLRTAADLANTKSITQGGNGVALIDIRKEAEVNAVIFYEFFRYEIIDKEYKLTASIADRWIDALKEIKPYLPKE